MARRPPVVRLWLLLLLAAMPAAALLLPRTHLLERAEMASLDWRFRLRQRLAPRPLPPQVHVIGVSSLDEAVLEDDLRTRQAHIDLLKRLHADGAAAVAFDLFFERTERFDDFLALELERLPAVLAFRFQSYEHRLDPPPPMPEDLAAAAAAIKNGTAAEAAALAQGKLRDYEELLTERHGSAAADEAALRAKLAATILWTRRVRRDALEHWFLESMAHDLPATEGALFRARSVALLSPSAMLAARQLGFANIEKGEEEVVRRVPLVYEYRGRLFPNLALAAALAYYDVPFAEVSIRPGDAIEFTPRRHGDEAIRIPIDRRGRYLVNFRGGNEFIESQRALSAVIRPEIAGAAAAPAGAYAGAIVLVGQTITGGTETDTQPIPLETRFPMVGLHANAVANILQRDFLRVRPAGVAVLVQGLMTLMLALAFRFLPVRGAMAVGVLLAVAYAALQVHGFVFANVVGTLVGPLLAHGTGMLLLTGYVVGVAERDRRLVREVFGKTVSPRIGEEILRRYEDRSLWGAQRTVTVLFVDLRGYTTLSENADPQRLLHLLERFYDATSEAVFRHDGQVNKFLGDAVLALFGALPDEPADHAERALRAAVAVQAALRDLSESEEFRTLGLRLRAGAGVNTGVVTVGIVGRRETRIEFTALGDGVNVAARLQALAGAAEIAIGGETVAAVGGPDAVLFPRLGLHLAAPETLAVKGRSQPVEVFRAHLDSTSRDDRPRLGGDAPA